MTKHGTERVKARSAWQTSSANGLVIVVADPGLEQVAEDVEAGGFERFAAQEVRELRDRFRCFRRQMQVGDKQVRGGAIDDVIL